MGFKKDAGRFAQWVGGGTAFAFVRARHLSFWVYGGFAVGLMQCGGCNFPSLRECFAVLVNGGFVVKGMMPARICWSGGPGFLEMDFTC